MVTAKFLRAYEEGRRLRRARIDRGESQHEAAVRLGISVVELSHREHPRMEKEATG